MKIQIENSVMTCELDAGESVERHVLQNAIQRATEAGLWSVFLVLRPDVANDGFDVLSSLGFRSAGNLSRDNMHYLKLKKHIRTSGETGNLAVAQPMLAPSHEEAAATELVHQRMSVPLSEARLQELAAMGKNDTPAETPDPLIQKMKADIAASEAQRDGDA